MKQTDLLKQIHQYDLFSELSFEELQTVFTHLEAEQFPKGHHIINQGDYGQKAYFLVKGVAEAYLINKSGERVLIGRLQEGSFFGELSLLLNSPRNNFVQAITACEAYSLTKEKLDYLSDKYASIRKAINKILSKRLSETLKVISQKSENTIVLMICDEKSKSRVEHFETYLQKIAPKEIVSLPPHLEDNDILKKLEDIENSYIIIKISENPSDLLAKKAKFILNFIKSEENHLSLTEDKSTWHIENAARRIAKKTIGIALCSGGAPAAAHIGVLEVLDQANIPFDYIVGTSAGAMIGFSYALGLSVEIVKKEALEFIQKNKFLKLLDILPYIALNGKGLIRSAIFKKFFHRFIEDEKNIQLKIPFAAIASDLFTGNTILLKDNNWMDAITASNAAPIFMEPIKFNDQLLIDGAATAPLPVQVLMDANIHIKIAVPIPQLDLITPISYQSKLFAIYMRSRSMMVERIMHQSIELADVIINPDVHGLHMDNWSQTYKVIEAGKTAAQIALSRIEFLLYGHSK